MSTTHPANRPLENIRNLASQHSRQPAVGSSAYRIRLISKEIRQIAPLLFALVGCGLILHLFGLITPRHDREWFHKVISVLIPTLFAVGAGPMLVSQEKEQRTLGWLGSLPIPWRSIVLSKLLIGASALACCWLVSLGLAFAFDSSLFRAESFGVSESVYTGSLYWVAYTFFLFFLGYALTWLCGTGLSALIASLIICSVAAVVSGFAQFLWEKNVGTNNTFDGWLILNNLIACVCVGALAIRYGSRSFTAGGASESWSNLWEFPDWRYRTVSRPRASTHSAASSLIWQIAVQNRMLWVASGMILLLGLSWQFIDWMGYTPSALFPFLQLLGFLIVSWLGVSVFGSDANRDRIRFLADRGIAPGLVWWTRLILPLVLVTIGLIVYYLIHRVASRHLTNTIQSGVVPWRVAAIPVLMIFAFTQWFSQWFRSTLIVFCLAPVVAVIVSLYTVFTYELGATWWLLLASMAVALIATRLMLRRWMDGRLGLRYWFSHSVLLFVSLVIPAIPFLVTYTTYPAIPASLRQSWEVEAQQYGHSLNATELVLALKQNDHSDGNSTGKTSEESNDFSASIDQLLQSLERQLADSSRPLEPVVRPVRFVLDAAKIASLSLEKDASNERARVRYQKSVLLLSSILPRMRISDRTLSQEIADRIEAWLVTELQQPNREQILGSENYDKIVQSFSNREARDQARRRAIVLSWNGAARNEAAYPFGLSWPHDHAIGTGNDWLVSKRNLGLATAALLKHLDPSETLKLVRFPASLRSYYQTISDQNRAQRNEVLDLDSIKLPGLLWHQDWEDQAERLLNSEPAAGPDNLGD